MADTIEAVRADMTALLQETRAKGLTAQHVKWAADHDWFRGALEMSPGCWAVIADDTTYWAGEVVTEATATFTDIRKLREHAGY